MKKILIPLTLILMLTACAPTEPVTLPVTAVPLTETSVPTSESTSTLPPTSTPEPTATLTATPYPVPEGAVKAADGSTVFVKEGKLWQIDAQGKAAEKDILDVTFANVLDSGNIVKQLHPEYFENNQELLKKTLLPDGVAINQKYKWRVEDFVVGSYSDLGVYTVNMVGQALNVSRVRWGDKSVAVMNFALMGADESIPVVVGVMENDSQVTSFITDVYSPLVGIDGPGAKNKGESKHLPVNFKSFANSLAGKHVGMDIVAFVDPAKSKEFYGILDIIAEPLKNNSDYSTIIHDSATRQMANTGWLTKQENESKPNKDRFTTSGEFLGEVMEDSPKDPGKLGPGFIINNDRIFLYKDK